MPALRYLLFLVGIAALLSSCKHEPEPVNKIRIGITPGHGSIMSDDSLKFTAKAGNGDPDIQWSLSAPVGTIDQEGLYIGPGTITTDTLDLIIKASMVADTGSYAIAALQLVNNKQLLISYAKEIQPVFSAQCNYKGCHGNGSRAARVELSTYDSAIKHITPFWPLSSSIYRSVIEPDITRVMPPAGPLRTDKITLLKKWIEQGAMNN